MQSLRSEIDFCLLIPCYNNFNGLIISLKSVVYPADRFLILVVDDGSKEAVTEERVQQEIGKAKPVVVIQNEKNLGITATLNNGLRWIEKNIDSKYIARLDCGDICVEERFVIQVQYMDEHPEVGLIGSWCIFEDKNTFEKYYYKTPLDHLGILKAMHFRNVFIHPTTIFRTTLLSKVGNYPISFEHAEDYAFFWKLINYQPSHIIDRFLVTCEINLSGISYSNRRKQLISRWKIVKTYGSHKIMKIRGFIRILLLYIIPKSLVLHLKKMIAD